MIKVIILAAEYKNRIDSSKPKCLLKIGDTTILERQLGIISYVLKIDFKDIIICIGKKGEIWSKKNINYIKNLGLTVVENPINDITSSSYSLHLSLQKIRDEVIVIDGDVIFSREILNKIIYKTSDNVLLVNETPSISYEGSKIICSNQVVEECGTNIKPDQYPYFIYTGICRLSLKSVEWFKKLSDDLKNVPFIDVISLTGLKFSVIDELDSFYNKQTSLTGGSYANLLVETIVRKRADTKGRNKLIKEIDWLTSLDKRVKKSFIPIIRYEITDTEAWFEMPYYDLPNLRSLILSGELNLSQIFLIIKEILDFMFN